MDAETAPFLDAEFEDIGNQRRADRRAQDRRGARFKLDPLFAATLINHVIRPEALRVQPYPTPAPALRAGVVVNLRA